VTHSCLANAAAVSPNRLHCLSRLLLFQILEGCVDGVRGKHTMQQHEVTISVGASLKGPVGADASASG
jgi:hypothetical protein